MYAAAIARSIVRPSHPSQLDRARTRLAVALFAGGEVHKRGRGEKKGKRRRKDIPEIIVPGRPDQERPRREEERERQIIFLRVVTFSRVARKIYTHIKRVCICNNDESSMARPSALCNTATTGPPRRGAPLSPKVPIAIVARRRA